MARVVYTARDYRVLFSSRVFKKNSIGVNYGGKWNACDTLAIDIYYWNDNFLSCRKYGRSLVYRVCVDVIVVVVVRDVILSQ